MLKEEANQNLLFSTGFESAKSEGSPTFSVVRKDVPTSSTTMASSFVSECLYHLTEKARPATNGHRPTSVKPRNKRIRTDTSVDAIEIDDPSRVTCSTSYGGAVNGLPDLVSARVMPCRK